MAAAAAAATAKLGGRPRIRDKEEPRQHLGFPVPVALKRQLEIAAAANGRSLSQEGVERLTESFRPVVGFPPELEAFLELLGRTMLDVGETVGNANRWAGHGDKSWIGDAYAWNQAVEAATHLLELSRHEDGEPHGIFASSAYPERLAKELGKQSADGIREVLRGWRDPDPNTTTVASQWARPMRPRLGSIGDRLDRHPSPEEYFVRTRMPLDEAAKQGLPVKPGLKKLRRAKPAKPADESA